ncbi:glucan synthase [Trifolium repens]|nr:glucan synthase [Trifolium repens]
MYRSLNNPQGLQGWNGGDPCQESWIGVACSGFSVIHIKIQGMRLTGSLGAALYNLTGSLVNSMHCLHYIVTILFTYFLTLRNGFNDDACVFRIVLRKGSLAYFPLGEQAGQRRLMIGKRGINGSGNKGDWESIKTKVGILGGMMNKLIFVDQVLVRGLLRYFFLFVSLSISMVWSITLTSLGKAKTCWLYLFMACDSWNIPLGEGTYRRKCNPQKTEFNILPLEQGGIQHAIMQQHEAAIAVIRDIRGLPPAQDFKKHGAFVDLFDFLQHCFGFQQANVANQREHLILLLANMQTRQTHNQTSVMKLGEGGVDELMRKFFKNYTTWCKILERKSNIRYVS